MSKFEDLKNRSNYAMSNVCAPVRQFMNELMLFLESQVKGGKLAGEYDGAREEWTDNSDTSPDEDGDYLVRMNGKEVEACWNGDDDEWTLKSDMSIVLSDQHITDWKRKV
jgi:hypothetical protein